MSDQGLGRWPVSLVVPVAWGDMDSFEHVNNTVYLRWFETARIAYFEQIGLLTRMRRDGIGPILARLTCDYRRALEYPDVVRIESTVTSFGTSSFLMGYRVFSERLDALAAEGEGVLVLFDYGAERKAPLDDELRTAIRSFESMAGDG